jgi:hypothetical protein
MASQNPNQKSRVSFVISPLTEGFAKQFIKLHSHNLALESTRKRWRVFRVSA